MATNDSPKQTESYSAKCRGVLASFGATLTFPGVATVIEGSDTTEIPYAGTDGDDSQAQRSSSDEAQIRPQRPSNEH